MPRPGRTPEKGEFRSVRMRLGFAATGFGWGLRIAMAAPEDRQAPSFQLFWSSNNRAPSPPAPPMNAWRTAAAAIDRHVNAMHSTVDSREDSDTRHSPSRAHKKSAFSAALVALSSKKQRGIPPTGSNFTYKYWPAKLHVAPSTDGAVQQWPDGTPGICWFLAPESKPHRPLRLAARDSQNGQSQGQARYPSRQGLQRSCGPPLPSWPVSGRCLVRFGHSYRESATLRQTDRRPHGAGALFPLPDAPSVWLCRRDPGIVSQAKPTLRRYFSVPATMCCSSRECPTNRPSSESQGNNLSRRAARPVQGRMG